MFIFNDDFNHRTTLRKMQEVHKARKFLETTKKTYNYKTFQFPIIKYWK